MNKFTIVDKKRLNIVDLFDTIKLQREKDSLQIHTQSFGRRRDC